VVVAVPTAIIPDGFNARSEKLYWSSTLFRVLPGKMELKSKAFGLCFVKNPAEKGSCVLDDAVRITRSREIIQVLLQPGAVEVTKWGCSKRLKDLLFNDAQACQFS